MATGRIGTTPVLQVRWSKAPSAGTTSLSGLDDNSVSLVYSVGYEAVYRNGVLLSRTNDYTATDGTTVTLIDATIAGDIIEIFANQLVPLTDAISKGQFTAKAALLSATAASTPAVLTVGANDTVLTADSSTATGLKWAAPSAGSFTKISTTSISAVASQDIDNVFSSSYNNYLVVVNYMHSITASTAEDLYLRFRYSSTTKTSGYFAGGFFVRPDSITGDFGSVENGGQFILATNLGAEASPTSGFFYVTTRGGSSSRLFINGQYYQEFGTGGGSASFFGGSTEEAQTWTGMRFLSSGGGNLYGEVTVYGMEK
jgi:hypothetical protein